MQKLEKVMKWIFDFRFLSRDNCDFMPKREAIQLQCLPPTIYVKIIATLTSVLPVKFLAFTREELLRILKNRGCPRRQRFLYEDAE